MMSKRQYYIEIVADYLARSRPVSRRTFPKISPDEFMLEGNRFLVMEEEFSSTVDPSRRTRFISIIPAGGTDMDALTVGYVPDFWRRDDDPIAREDACRKLAVKVVNEMLPKVDYRIKAELYNEEVDDLLSAL